MSRENRKRRIVELLYKQKFVLKVVDFGFSKQLNFLEEEILTNCGTPLNMAPEIMNDRPYNYKADIWSIGVQIFLLLTGSYPFIANTKEGLIHRIDVGLYSINRQLQITSYCLDFINKMLQYEPGRRMDWN
jgi:fused-like protein